MKDYLDTKDEVFVLEEKFLQDGPTNKDIVQKFNALRTHAKRYREARDENKASLEKVKGALASSADAFAEEKLRTTCAEEQFAAESQEKEDLLEQVRLKNEMHTEHLCTQAWQIILSSDWLARMYSSAQTKCVKLQAIETRPMTESVPSRTF